MGAGQSAAEEAQRQRALAQAHLEAAKRAEEAAGRYHVAGVSERRTAKFLAPLAEIGYHLLPDRAWPGSRRSQVDLVVVGPGGVFIVDTKAWKDVHIERDRLLRGQEDVSDSVLTIADLVEVTVADLAEIGLAPGEVHGVLAFAGIPNLDQQWGPLQLLGQNNVLRHIAAHGQRLSTTHVEQVLRRCMELFPVLAAPAPVVTTVPEPVLEPIQTALVSEEEISEMLLASVMGEPIEDWMSFLHPSQAKIAQRNFTGPSRVRGAAGTGKTVVGLHRAAWLARMCTSEEKVLVTSFVRTLPDVLRATMQRMQPGLAERIEFRGVHHVARDILADRGLGYRTDPAQIDEAWRTAWRTVGGPATSGVSPQERYWKDEISHVIKGRGLRNFQQYLELPRTGRSIRLAPSQRESVWKLYQSYTAELRARQARDYDDVISLACAELEREPYRRYSAVIIDEAQDLTCNMVRMLAKLAGDDRPNGLTIIGDGQQTIYPGCWTLRDAGISVTGRAFVLDTNYRNTQQIAAFASQLVGDDEYPDIEGSTERGGMAKLVRSGEEPQFVRAMNKHELLHAMVDQIHQRSQHENCGLGDIGILTRTLKGVAEVMRHLQSAGIPAINLDKYDGKVSEHVKVGTIKRAKGLEFKHVLVWAFPSDLAAAPLDPEQRESWLLKRRELYVAMTRARDTLWAGSTYR